MNKEAVDKWVAALRSGEYEQTKGSLKDDEGYCCLGVLCEVAIQEGVVRHWAGANGNGVPKSEVVDWVGLLSSNGGFADDDGRRNSLAGMNDRGATFEEIADTIEAKRDKIFTA